MRQWRAIALLTLSACGSVETGFPVRGATVTVRTDAAFTRSVDFPARVESTIEAALAYWGGSWADLDGSTIVFEGTAQVECPGIGPTTGCYDGDIRVTTQDAGLTVSCVEATVLVHEVGHAVIGDAAHDDPRWMDFEALAEVLVGRTGYTPSGTTPCVPVANVWRHPPRH
jgi:hypothetical protein